MRPLTFLLRLCLIAATVAGALRADETPEATEESTEIEGYFISRLAEIESLTTGVHELSKQEQANLENLIAYEVSSARAGGVNGFAKTFSERRSDSELEATGIKRMSGEQRERLDQHIAGFIADQPVSYVYQGEGRGRSTTRADTRPFTGKGPLLNVRNSVTLEVGTGNGGTYYGGSVTTVISDPKGRFNAIISYGTSRGNLPYYDSYGRGPYRSLSRP